MHVDRHFWKDRKVLLTGHTGFKGTWMALYLQELGARVTGLALLPESDPALFDLAGPWPRLDSHISDIRDLAAVKAIVEESSPEIVIHMAAQALVRRSYRDPVDTMTTNIQGTINVLESLRGMPNVSSILVITSDKVYRNEDGGMAFCEDSPLGGDDPYSASKAATEIVTRSWANSFFDQSNVSVLTARAGNVLGGGDFSEDRIVPDIWRAKQIGEDVVLRYPDATRPWQHVLDLCAGYLAYLEAAENDELQTLPSSLNFGPISNETMTVGAIAKHMLEALGGPGKIRVEPSSLTEKALLSIDTSRAQETIGWHPILNMSDVLTWTAEWYSGFDSGLNPRTLTIDQVHRHINQGR